MVPVAVSVSLFVGACAPHNKQAGYIAGSVLAISGGALIAHASSRDCSTNRDPNLPDWDLSEFTCVFGALGEGTLGVVTTVAGLVTLIAALASPSVPEAPGALTAPALAPATTEEQGAEPNQPRAIQLVPRGPARASVRLGFD